MRQLLTRLRPLVAGGTAAVGALRERFGDLRSDRSAANGLEKSIELQADLNATVNGQLTILKIATGQAVQDRAIAVHRRERRRDTCGDRLGGGVHALMPAQPGSTVRRIFT